MLLYVAISISNIVYFHIYLCGAAVGGVEEEEEELDSELQEEVVEC
jgi:hypothetical protein